MDGNRSMEECEVSYIVGWAIICLWGEEVRDRRDVICGGFHF